MRFLANDSHCFTFIFKIRIVGYFYGYCFPVHYVYLSFTPILFFEDTARGKPIPMVKKPPSKNDALEASDFIINVLKDHEKDLDRLIGELGKITSSVGETGGMSEKIDRVEGRLSTLQTEINNLVGYLSTPRKPNSQPTTLMRETLAGPAVIVRCKQWDDFKTLAKGSDTVSFLFKETEKGFQADALKDGRVLTFSGDLPKDGKLLKFWLARELEINEEKIFEGILSIG